MCTLNSARVEGGRDAYCRLRFARGATDIAMLDRESGEIVEKTLKHVGTTVRDFYAGLPPPVVVGIEATGSMGWFLR